MTLTPISGWDTFGFRGTCSLGFTLEATGDGDLVLDDSFGDISTATMLPTSHLLWSSLWLGLAEEASWRAQRFIQKAARKDLDQSPPGAPRLAALMVTRQQFASLRRRADEPLPGDPGRPRARPARSTSWSRSTPSRCPPRTLVVDIINQAMLIVGIQGYREDSEYTLGRILRDAHGAAVMVNNDRIAGNTAQLSLMQREVMHARRTPPPRTCAAALIGAGLLVETRTQGLYHRSGDFEGVLQGVERYAARAAVPTPRRRVAGSRRSWPARTSC